VHYDSKDARGIDVALLYNPKYFKVVSSEKIFIDMADLGEGKTRDILYVKGVFMGEELHVMVAHWPSRRGGEEASMARRCRAAEFMRKKADSVYALNPNANIVAMGDLNDDPTSPSLTQCLKAAITKEKAINGMFFNPFADYFRKGIGTLAYNDSWNLFDQIVVSSSMIQKENGLKFDAAYIFTRPYMTQMDGQYKGYPFRTYSGDVYQGGFSDHFPTYMVIKKRVGN
jgi:endonuclease/exonuclease/phosphatase family metal-dependent hydrolase